jgi:F-type H+-transporting ATPase subunit b
VTRSRADADRFREEMRHKAQEDAAAIVKNAEKEIQLETGRALAQIRTEAVDLSVAIASKLLRRNISAADNEALIQDAIGQFDKH